MHIAKRVQACTYVLFVMLDCILGVMVKSIALLTITQRIHLIAVKALLK